MLRVSSLGLTCRRHALCSSHPAALRRLRVVAVAGKAPVSEIAQQQVLQVAVHTGHLYVETLAAACGAEGPVEGERGIAVPVKEVVTTQSPQSHENAGDHNHAMHETIGVPLHKIIQPLRLNSRRRSAMLPSTVQVVPIPSSQGASQSRTETKPVRRSIRQKFEESLLQLQAPRRVKSRSLPGPAALTSTAHLPSLAVGQGGSPEESTRNSHRQELLHTLATTNSLTNAWHVYETLLSLPHDPSRLAIPWEHLHRLTRLIASTKPRTLPLFIRLLSVLSLIHKTGGHVQLWQWNALIDFAGKGVRKTKQENFRNALDVYNDMISRRPPGATFMRTDHDDLYTPVDNPVPDAVTLATLLNIGARTMHKPTMEFAASLQRNSGLPPTRITLLTYLRYYTRRGDMDGIRQIISQMTFYQYDVGLDGINAYIWAYGRNGRLDVASAIYSILRSRILGWDADACESAIRYLKDTEAIVVPEGIIPNKISYTVLLQVYAYHGHLSRCLQVFMDFVATIKNSGSDEEQLALTMQLMTIYRAIFLGFSRHGAPSPSDRLRSLQSGQTVDSSTWSLEVLDALFADFLAIPVDVKASPRTIYAVLVAFSKTSAQDTEKLREVFVKLREKFPGHWGGRLRRLQQKLFTL